MTYKNKEVKKIKHSRRMLVSCGHCKSSVIEYLKVGPGSLLKLYVSRVTESEMPLGEAQLLCPFCGERLAHLVRIGGEPVYKMIRGVYHTKGL